MNSTLYWLQRWLRHDAFYAALGLLCALLIAGVPAYLALFGSRAQPVAQAAAPSVVRVVTLPASQRARPATTDQRLWNNNTVVSEQLLAAEPFDDGLYLAGALDPSICRSVIPGHELLSEEPDTWSAPNLKNTAVPVAN
jgi:hypothetical protein